MTIQNKKILIPLAILNAIVLLGQLWPEGAPPFARFVNIGTVMANLVVLFLASRKQAHNQ